ncbi:MAG: HipA N-terminal domain-containing protein [Verrucomicrobia bacterium]|nr:HipA N-terminal domain-containing protein [Verrucomicrobiota bacterium]
MTEELSVFVEGRMMGCLLWDRRRDRLSFRYDTSWADFPLSLSMPLTASEHGHSVVEAFLWGLLPDNDGVLQRWGERFQVSPRNAFKLLWHVGEECAGAFQFIRPDRLATWSKTPPPGGVTWLTPEEVAGRIQLLLKDHSASRTSSDAGSFSLAGAQPKTAFIFDPKKKRWGIPFGSVPTTHILKPATGAFDGFAENEHFCLRLAGVLGFPTASSSVQYFGDCPVISKTQPVRGSTGTPRHFPHVAQQERHPAQNRTSARANCRPRPSTSPLRVCRGDQFSCRQLPGPDCNHGPWGIGCSRWPGTNLGL